DVLLLAKELSPVPSPLARTAVAEAGVGGESLVDDYIGDRSLREMLDDSEEQIRTLTAALLV
ncbi:hypothetical protein ABTJ92_20670, partial [Acinetobacter baumannii]